MIGLWVMSSDLTSRLGLNTNVFGCAVDRALEKWREDVGTWWAPRDFGVDVGSCASATTVGSVPAVVKRKVLHRNPDTHIYHIYRKIPK